MQLRKGRIIVLIGAVSFAWIASVSAADVPVSSKVQANIPSETAVPSLRLFMSAEEQRAAENRNSQIKTNTVLPLEVSSAVVPEHAIEASEKTKSKLNSSASTLLKEKYKQARYDGVVLRNGAVLGLWVNAKRFSVSVAKGGVRLENVRANGQASFFGTLQATGNTATVRLNPGDLVPFKSIEFGQALQKSTPDSSTKK